MPSEVLAAFAGTWRLISYTAVTPDGVTTYPFGPDAQGRLIYEATGRMAVQIGQPGQSPFASGDPRRPSGAEAQTAYGRYLAYFGTFSVDRSRGIVVHHLEVSLTPDWAGGDLVRHYVLEDDHLTLTTDRVLFGGTALVTTLVWEKMR